MTGTVLLVHDDIATIAVARRVLVSEGLEVILATSSADAIIAFGQRPPDLVVLAPSVDGGRGEAVYTEIRSLPRGARTRFLLLGGAIPGAKGTAVIELPVVADRFREAVQTALAAPLDPSGWALQAPGEEPEGGTAETPREQPEEWRIADARDTITQDEPLADQLFGDLRAEEPPTGAERRPTGALSLLTKGNTPVIAPPEREPTEPDEIPEALRQLPLDSPSDEGVTAAQKIRPATAPSLASSSEPLLTEVDAAEHAARLAQEQAEAEQMAAEATHRAREKLLAKVEAARSARAEAERQAQAARNQRERLEAELQAVEAELSTEAEARREAEAGAEAAARRLIELENAQLTAQAWLSEARAAREAAERALADDQPRIEALSGEVDALQTQAREAEAAQAELASRREAALARQTQADQARQSAEEAEQAHLAEQQKLEAELGVLEAQVAQSEARAEAARRAEGLAEARAAELAERLAALQAQLAEAEGQAEDEEQNRAEAEQVEGAQAERVKALELQLEQAERAAHARAAGRVEAERSVEDLSGPIAALENGVAEAQAQLAEEEQQLADLAKRRSELEAQHAGTAQALLDAELQAKQVRSQRGTEQQVVQELQDEVRLEAERLAKFHQSRGEAEVRLAQAGALRSRLEGELESTRAQAASAEESAQQAEERAQQQAARAAELGRSAEELKQRLQVAESARVEALTHVESLTLKLAHLAEQTQKLAAEAEAAEAELAKLQAQRAELEAQNEKAQSAHHAAEERSRSLAARREEFQKAVAAAESERSRRPRTPPEPEAPPVYETVRPPTAPAPRARPPSRPPLRPLTGGRWKRPEARPDPGAPELSALDPQVPAFAEGPAEPRPPNFPLSGELAELGAAAFFAGIWRERVTGRFDVDGRDGARAFFFEEGRLVAALSTAPTDRLEAIAQRDGLITRAQERVLRQESSGLAPRQLAVRMVELQLLKGTELYGLVRRHMEQVAYALFAEEAGAYAYQPEVAPPEHRVALPVHPLAFMLEGVRRKGDFDRLNGLLGGPSALVRLREGGPELAELGLTARERRFVSLIDGLRTVEELIFASGLEPPAAVKLLHGLAAARSVEVIPGEPAALDDRAPELQIDLARVAEKYEQVRDGDYFEILGVPREATTYEVRAAFERLAREFHPARFAAVDDPSLPGRLEEIGRMVAEAADVLADDHTRRAYARHLSETG